MDRSAIPLILQTLNLKEEDVTNIYHHGSWIYGTNSPTSDRDLLIVTRSLNNIPLKFWSDFDYFHDFQCLKLWDQYDIGIYTTENFEILLEKNYLICVQCIFLPDEFILKNEIDFKSIYLEKYCNTIRIKLGAFYEMYRDWKLYKPENNSLSRRDYIFKHLFHGLRYLDFAEQLIQTQSIHNYKRVTYIFDQMKAIRDEPPINSSMERVAEFVNLKSIEFRSKLDVLVPTNIIKGSFEAMITFNCNDNNIENLEKLCNNTKYKFILIHSGIDQDKNKSEQLIVSSQYHGEYPLIIRQIEQEIYHDFKDFNIVRLQIESLVSNEGVPEGFTEKKLFWNRSNYFAFYYLIPLEKDGKGENLKKIVNTYRSKHRFNSDNIDLLHNEFKQTIDNNLHYISIMRLFNVGREKALVINDEIIENSNRNNLPLTLMKSAFIVYEKNIGLNHK
ncbi:unnamed protein product [Adineta steineri]|uniref:Polymerase nucleotidyl transferase domain-containing protein n=1 Tax=Adineta steineri TaxID=433720 RepID=A0A815XP78_9BILA|nr:unnamed protein product [Adineta steineri]CAF1560092.1 unnamed protein product [Adineta steineri]CAF1664463.1 unnamed protein product [Adineta steineri]CAF1664473.1 unnamed protein product [Adineta steineri]